MVSTSNVMVGRPRVGGAIWRLPLGVLLPTDALAHLPESAVDHGYASADGLEIAISKSFEAITAWGGDEVARPRTEHSVTATFTLIESGNADVARTIWGEDSVTVTPATTEHGTQLTIAYTGADLPPAAWIFDMADGANLRRIVVPHAQIVTEDFTRTFVDNAPVAYPVTLVMRADEHGVFFYEHLDDGTVIEHTTPDPS